jgi:GMP synthase (glutamine-hydrolysing)
MVDAIAILDFGSQYTQLIARRVREMQVFCEIFAWDAPREKVMALQPKGFILSGGPSSVYDANAPYLLPYLLESGLPILGICYGMQALTIALGGEVGAAGAREYGLAEIEVSRENALIPCAHQKVWMSHGDRIEKLPQGFVSIAHSSNSPYAGMENSTQSIFGVQFHPEVHHTERGKEILSNFVLQICQCRADWTPQNIIDKSIREIRERAGGQKVISAVSGGVDSSVATALVHRAIGSQLSTVFIDTGLLRKDEVSQVQPHSKTRWIGSDHH